MLATTARQGYCCEANAQAAREKGFRHRFAGYRQKPFNGAAKSEMRLSARHVQGSRKKQSAPRIRIRRLDDASARCSASIRPDQPSGSCQFTRPATTHSTYSAIPARQERGERPDHRLFRGRAIVGRLVACVVNMPPRNIIGFQSEVPVSLAPKMRARRRPAVPARRNHARRIRGLVYRSRSKRPNLPHQFQFRHELVRIIGLDVAVRLLPLRQDRLFARQLLVGNLRQKMRDDIQPRALLVVRAHHVPRRPRACRSP